MQRESRGRRRSAWIVDVRRQISIGRNFPRTRSRRLTRADAPEADEAIEPQSKAPEGREPEAEPSVRPSVAPEEASSKPALVRRTRCGVPAVRAAADRADRRRLHLRDRRQRSMSTENAYVQADMVGVSTDVSGIVSEIDGQGEPEGRGRRHPVQARRPAVPARARHAPTPSSASSRNELSRAAGQLSQHAGADRAGADRRRLSTTRNFKRQQAARGQQLRLAGGVRARAAQSSGRAAEARLAQPAARRHRRQPERRPRRAGREPSALQGALAARDEAARQLDHTTVRAPIAGIVTNVPSLQPGQYLAASTSALQRGRDRPCLGRGQSEGDRADLCAAGPEGDRRGRHLSGQSSGPARSTASARPRRRASRCCRPEHRAATGSRSCSASRCGCASRTPPGKPPLRVGMSVELNVETGHARGLPDASSRGLVRRSCEH